ANAGGNMLYWGPDPSMQPAQSLSALGGGYWGTSAATPMWASLAAQIDTTFHDQGLPRLGFANDLFYTAAAIAPASFNDVTMGNNTSSYLSGGRINNDGTGKITLTGFGYQAGPGYDLTTGLGSPNGTVLARSLSAIAHAQMYFPSVPDVLDAPAAGSSAWTS